MWVLHRVRRLSKSDACAESEESTTVTERNLCGWWENALLFSNSSNSHELCYLIIQLIIIIRLLKNNTVIFSRSINGAFLFSMAYNCLFHTTFVTTCYICFPLQMIQLYHQSSEACMRIELSIWFICIEMNCTNWCDENEIQSITQ